MHIYIIYLHANIYTAVLGEIKFVHKLFHSKIHHITIVLIHFNLKRQCGF